MKIRFIIEIKSVVDARILAINGFFAYTNEEINRLTTNINEKITTVMKIPSTWVNR